MPACLQAVDKKGRVGLLVVTLVTQDQKRAEGVGVPGAPQDHG